VIIGYVLFFIAGLGFGYAAPGGWKLLALFFPVALALGAIASDGLDPAILLRLVVALLVTLAGILIGGALGGRRGEAVESE
jgi:hypothetical protein